MSPQRSLYFEDASTGRLVRKLENRLNEIAGWIYRERVKLPHFRIRQGETPGGEHVDFDDSGWEEFHVPGTWGAYLANFWFRTRFVMPEQFAGKKVCAYLRVSNRGGLRGAEGLVYVNGEAVQGVALNRQEVLLEEKASPAKEHTLAMEIYSGLTDEKHPFDTAELRVIDEAVEDLYYTGFATLDAARSLDPVLRLRKRLLDLLDEAFRNVDFRYPGSETFNESLAGANAFLKEGLKKEKNDATRPTVTCVGHAHLDVVWLWTLSQTRRKAARTFSNSLRAMERHPNFIFLASQAQLYDFVRQDHPRMFEQVKRRVAEGRWEAPGGMWVEPDCNLTGGESLVRQFIFGKRFFKQQLGVESDVMWFPDSFGYSGALPQIAAKCGMKYFMTTKISWNDTNRFPYDTFWWEGIDGTRILAHMVTTPTPGLKRTYNGNLTPAVLKGTWERYLQKELNDEVLMAFGWGDGGGGPTKDMLETAKRIEDFPGMPKCRMGTAEGFYERLGRRAEKAEVPVWVGELYLEYHRGTFTTQGWIKRANRKNEMLYRDAEALATLAAAAGEQYPADELRKGWEILLRNQFHDILPGSSIAEAYADCRDEHEEARGIGEKVRERALAVLGKKIDTGAAARSGEMAAVVWNTISWERTGVASLPLEAGQKLTVLDENGEPVAQQVVEKEGGKGELLFTATDVPSMGHRVFQVVESRGKAEESGKAGALRVSPERLENEFFEIRLNENAAITSLVDKRSEREVIPAGKRANLLQVFEDKPLANSAWDIEYYFEEKMWEPEAPERVQVIEEGPVRAGVSVTRKFLDSTIRQKTYIYRDVPRIDFETDIDWEQSEMLMKAAFPVEVLSRRATYEIQFGNIERATHRNTSWEQAMFEVPAHKWVDLSEGGYGVSLLNDCRYGHDIRNNVMRITLLRSPVSPDPKADRGVHVMTYSLYPHEGDWREGGTTRAGYELNCPLIARLEDAHEGEREPSRSFLTVGGNNVIVETVKRAEEGDEVVVRLYECFGHRGEVTVEFGEAIRNAAECDLLETERRELKTDGRRVSLFVKPYEIRTLIVSLE